MRQKNAFTVCANVHMTVFQKSAIKCQILYVTETYLGARKKAHSGKCKINRTLVICDCGTMIFDTLKEECVGKVNLYI